MRLVMSKAFCLALVLCHIVHTPEAAVENDEHLSFVQTTVSDADTLRRNSSFLGAGLDKRTSASDDAVNMATLLNRVRCQAFLQSLIAGLSTTLGAALVLLTRGPPSPAQMAFALALAGGVMVTVSVIEMWLPQLINPKHLHQTILCAITGMVAVFGLMRFIPDPSTYYADTHREDDELDLEPARQKKRDRSWRLAIMMMCALTIHNFPEGLAVAVSSLESQRLGIVVMAAIAVHNIPEGIAIAMPVLEATGSRMRALQMATLSGLAEPLGAVVALTALPEGAGEGRCMSGLLSFVGGVMCCVALTELFPEANKQQQPASSMAGLLTGVGIMMLTHSLA